MFHVCGERIQQGQVVKIADDPYVGVSSLARVLHIRRLTLTALNRTTSSGVDQAQHRSRADMVQRQLTIYVPHVSLLHSPR